MPTTKNAVQRAKLGLTNRRHVDEFDIMSLLTTRIGFISVALVGAVEGRNATSH